jgi:chaperonin GroES
MYEPSEMDDATRLKLPKPVGYHLLVTTLDVREKTDGGVYMPDSIKDAESTASIIGLVVAVGGEAYSDPVKFPSGPWCKEGDFVIFRSYSGTRFKIGGKEFRLVNDDTVEAVVDDPRGFARV